MIKSVIVFILAALMGLAIQSTLIHSVFPSAVAPDFILILSVYLALRLRSALGVFIAFGLGILADFASGQFLGPNACGCVVAYGSVVVISEKVYAEKQVAMAILTFFASIAKSTAFLLMLAIYLKISVLAWSIVQVCLIEALFSAAVAPIVVWLLDFRYTLKNKTGKRSSLAGVNVGRQGQWSR